MPIVRQANVRDDDDDGDDDNNVVMVVFGNVDDDYNGGDDDEERHLCGGSLPRRGWMKYYAGLGTINQNAFQMEPLAKDHGL